MKASVVKLNFHLPTAQAVTANHIAVAFRPPAEISISLLDELDIDLENLDTEQDVLNLTTGKRFRANIATNNIHDLTFPPAHGTSRFPSLARRRGG
jgi:hypothetical protein